MKVKCLSCGHELNLDHSIFKDYSGPVKCFSCGRMMEVKTVRGILHSINPPAMLENESNPVLIETRH
jgi:uncharacterized Zn finger protein